MLRMRRQSLFGIFKASGEEDGFELNIRRGGIFGFRWFISSNLGRTSFIEYLHGTIYGIENDI